MTRLRRDSLPARGVGRRLLAAASLTGLVLLLAHPGASATSDAFSNIAPASQLSGGSLTNAYPLGHYTLDHHFAAVKAGVFHGIDASGVPPTIAWVLATICWLLTVLLAYSAITLFTFAFSLDLVNGSAATGNAGALAPVSTAVRSIYDSTFGQPWLVAAIVATGLWAMWHALVRRRYTETASALGVSVLFILIALAFVTHPERTIGQATKWTNKMSVAFLSLSAEGNIDNADRAKRNAADQLFGLLVYEPWVVLEFGGLEHCVRDDGQDQPVSVPVRPLSGNPARDARLTRDLAHGSDIQADGKTCINNRNKYAPRFLRYAAGSDERDGHSDALRAGDTDKAPVADREGYTLSKADKAAADAMSKDNQYQRLALALVILGGEVGAVFLLAALSFAVILAQIIVLLLLAFAPVALVLGVFPHRGHEFFKDWLSRLMGFVLRKAIYSLVLAVLLAVAAALADATSALGWLMAFGLQAAFFWGVFLLRHQLVGQLIRATTGQGAEPLDRGVRFASLYAAARLARPRRRRRKPGRRPGQRQMSRRDEDDPPPPPDPEPPAGEPDNDELRGESPADERVHWRRLMASARSTPTATRGDSRTTARPNDQQPEQPEHHGDRRSSPGKGGPASARPAKDAASESPLQRDLRADERRLHASEDHGKPASPPDPDEEPRQ